MTHVPLVLRDDIEEMQIQSTKTERPLTGVPVRALKVGTSSFEGWWDVPAAATLVCNEGEIEVRSDMLCKFRVLKDGTEAIMDRKIGSS